MPQPFETRIDQLVGEGSSGDIGTTTAMKQDMFDEGLRAAVRLLPVRALSFASKQTTFAPTSGVQVKNPVILRVLRKDGGSVNRPCVQIDLALVGAAGEKGSFHEASAFTPVYYLEPQASGFVTLKVLPTSATAADGTLYHMAIPPISISNTTMVAGFPEELEGLPVFYAAGLVLMRESGVTRRVSQDQVEAAVTAMGKYASALPALVVPAAPAVQALVYETAGDAPSSTVTISSIIPVFVAPPPFTYDTTHTADALTQMQDMMDNSGVGSSDIESYIDTAKHLEQANVAIRAMLAEGQRAQTSINDEVAQLREYEAELQEKLGKFQTEVAARNSEVTEQVAEVNAGIATYSAEQRDHLNAFNALAGQYQSDLQRYAGEVGAKVQEFQGKLQSAASYLTEAQAHVGAAASYDGKAALAWQTGNGYIKHFRDEIQLYKKGTLEDGR